MRKKIWFFGCILLVLFGVFAGISASFTAVSFTAAEAAWVDLSGQVKVEVSRASFDRQSRVFFSYLKITNISGTSLVGPVRVLIVSSTIPVSSIPGPGPNGFEGQSPWFYVLNAGQSLLPNAAKTLRINFEPQRKPLSYTVKVEKFDSGLSSYYRDADGDGFGNPAQAVTALSAPPGYVVDNTDCNDQDAAIHPRFVGQSLLVKATVSLYRLSDLTAPISTAKTDEAGFLSLCLDPSAVGGQDEYLLIAVSGGQVLDSDNDGVLDRQPTENAGSLHALVMASQLSGGSPGGGGGGGIRVSFLTDIVWRYTKNLVDQTDKRGIGLRLDDLAAILLKEDEGDFNGDGVVNAADFLAFNPASAAHRAGLNFDYQSLFTEDENGRSIAKMYYQNNEQELLELLDDLFGVLITLNATLDTRNPVVKIELAPFGRGKVVEASGKIHFDSEGDPSQNATSAFFDKDLAGKVVLKASPIEETEILGWEGCDAVSEDLTECECHLDRDHAVRVTFGYKETKVIPNFVDLSDTEVERDNYTLHVIIDYADDELRQKMAAMTPGYYVVGSTGDGFLLKVVSVNKISDFEYILETEEATLDEVVLQGTGVLSKKMTHGDLAAGEEQLERVRKRGAWPGNIYSNVSTIDGVRLLPSQDPNDTVFTFQFGQPISLETEKKRDRVLNDKYHWEQGVELFTEDNFKTNCCTGKAQGEVNITGSVDLEIWIDVAVSYRFSSGLEAFRFVPKVKAVEKIDVVTTGEIEGKCKKNIATIPFERAVKFFIGPVPVWLTFKLDISIGAEAEVEAKITTSIEFEQVLTAGINYQSKTGLEEISQFDKSWKFNPPKLDSSLEARVFLAPGVSVLIYGVSGPQFVIEPYFKLTGKGKNGGGGGASKGCEGGMLFSTWFGLSTYLTWKTETNTKLGKMLVKITKGVEIPITNNEWLIREWLVGADCPEPPHLEVRGPNVYKIIEYGSSGTISQTYTLTNTGQGLMEWSIDYSNDGCLSVSPKSGQLEGGKSVTVTASVKAADLEIGNYYQTIVFNNNSVSGDSSGSCSRAFEIKVNPPVIPTPTLKATKIFATKVTLSWSVPDTKWIDGYWILISRDPAPDAADKDWELAEEITDRKKFSCQISKLSPDVSYYFVIIAYNNNNFQSEPSNLLTLSTSNIIQPGEEKIQEAIDAADDGKELIVKPGVYYENLDFKGKALKLLSINPEDPSIVAATIIDGGQKGRVVTIRQTKSGQPVVLSGFTIRNGNTSYDGAKYGGGIYCDANTTTTISHCTISGNSAQDGGGIYGGTNTTTTISHCTISGNSAEYGGGILCRGNTSISNCTISGNSAKYSGGGISCWGDTSISHCTISDNSAQDGNGGGILCGDHTSISNCTISDNSAKYGGGILCGDYTSISNCTISGNSAQDGNGGGIYCWDHTSINNCTISGNSAERHGGGIYCWDDTSINNCTISDNSAKYGGGILCRDHTSITNSILWANSPNQIYSSSLSLYITYSDIQGGWSGEGNINADPLFVNPEAGDFHLQAGSPCIDAGRSGQDIPAYDLDGKQRDSRPDMGAYEY